MLTVSAASLLVACTPDDTDDMSTLFSASNSTQVVAISANGNAVAVLETPAVDADRTTLHVVDLDTRRSNETALQATVTSATPVVVADDGSMLAWFGGELTRWDGTEATLVASDVEAYDASWDLTRAIVERDVDDELPVEVFNLIDNTSLFASALGRDPVRACLDSTTASQVFGPDGVIAVPTCAVAGNGAQSFSYRASGLLHVHAPGYERQLDVVSTAAVSTWLDTVLVYVDDGKTHVLDTLSDTLTVHDVIGTPVAYHDGVLYLRDNELGLLMGSESDFTPIGGLDILFIEPTATGVAWIEVLDGAHSVAVHNDQLNTRVTTVTPATSLHVAGDTVYVASLVSVAPDVANLVRVEDDAVAPVADAITDIWSNGETVVWAYTQDSGVVLESAEWSESFSYSPSAFLVPGGALVTGHREGRFRTILHR